MWVHVFGGGGGGKTGSGGQRTGGGGGGYAAGIINVTPGQTLPTITVGSGGTAGVAGGTSSFGTLLTATGGAASVYSSTSAITATGGVGSYSGAVTDPVTYAGGSSIRTVYSAYSATGGGAGGGPYGNGSDVTNSQSGGSIPINLNLSTSAAFTGTNGIEISSANNIFISLANKSLCDHSIAVGNSYGIGGPTANTAQTYGGPFGGGGGSMASNSTITSYYGGIGGIGGGGGGSLIFAGGNMYAGAGGSGMVLLIFTKDLYL
jgi:hypothetical protein